MVYFVCLVLSVVTFKFIGDVKRGQKYFMQEQLYIFFLPPFKYCAPWTELTRGGGANALLFMSAPKPSFSDSQVKVNYFEIKNGYIQRGTIFDISIGAYAPGVSTLHTPLAGSMKLINYCHLAFSIFLTNFFFKRQDVIFYYYYVIPSQVIFFK